MRAVAEEVSTCACGMSYARALHDRRGRCCERCHSLLSALWQRKWWCDGSLAFAGEVLQGSGRVHSAPPAPVARAKPGLVRSRRLRLHAASLRPKARVTICQHRKPHLQVDLGQLYEGVPPGTRYRLRSMVCYYGAPSLSLVPCFVPGPFSVAFPVACGHGNDGGAWGSSGRCLMTPPCLKASLVSTLTPSVAHPPRRHNRVLVPAAAYRTRPATPARSSAPPSGRHYQALVRLQELHERWVLFDDTSVSSVGDWSEVG